MAKIPAIPKARANPARHDIVAKLPTISQAELI